MTARIVPLALLAGVAWAAPLVVGDVVAPFSLEDQHGARVDVGARVRRLLVTRDMKAGDIVKETLADAGAGHLDDRAAVYVADVSRMPALVTRLFALPKLRRRPYRMLLDRDGETMARFPSEEGRVTVLHLDAGRITRVVHAATVAELRAALEDPAAAVAGS